jgi:Rrf2 family protein
MLLTRECDYGIRLVRALAQRGEGSVAQLCDDEHVPTQYAYKILKKLERAGIVLGHRGPHGGYKLLRSPIELTLLHIVLATEEEPVLSACLETGFSCPRNTDVHPCSVHKELCKLQKMMVDELNKKTLADVFEI